MSTQDWRDSAVMTPGRATALNMPTAIGPTQCTLHCLGARVRFLCEIAVTRASGECLAIEAFTDVPEDSEIVAGALWISVNLFKPLASTGTEGLRCAVTIYLLLPVDRGPRLSYLCHGFLISPRFALQSGRGFLWPRLGASSLG
jgi:hypothetical protein